MTSLQESYNRPEREFISKWAAIKITQSPSTHSGETIARSINRNIIRSLSLSQSPTHTGHTHTYAHARRTRTDAPSAPAGRIDSVQPLWSNKAVLAVDAPSLWQQDLGADWQTRSVSVEEWRTHTVHENLP